MRVARVVLPGGEQALCRHEGDHVVPLLVGGSPDPLLDLLATGEPVPAEPVAESVAAGTCTFLPPVQRPSSIVAIGLNYRSHAEEMSPVAAPPPADAPEIFTKTGNTLTGHDRPISYRRTPTSQVDYEGELAVVIGRTAATVGVEDALDHVFGVTVCNDVSERHVQFSRTQWALGKCFDSFLPIGPALVTLDELDDVQDLGIRTRVDGEVVQDSRTSRMLLSVAEIVSYLSQTMTLLPGDVIATGTPEGVGYARQPPTFLTDGSVVEVEIEGVGTLRNKVVER